MDPNLRHAPIGVLTTDSDGTLTGVNQHARRLLEIDEAALEGREELSIRELFPQSASGTLHSTYDGSVSAEKSFEEYYPALDRWLGVTIVPVESGITVYVRDRSQVQEQASELDQVRRRLDRMQRIDETVAAVLSSVIDSSGRADIAETVCKRLQAEDLYEFVWVAEPDPANDRLQPVANAGTGADLFDQIKTSLDGETTLPEREAFQTGDTQHVDNIADASMLQRDIRLTAFSLGVNACVAVPLRHWDSVFAVLGIYSGREDGFDARERASLDVLGRVAGLAINAGRQESLLSSGTVTEVTLEVRDQQIPFVDGASQIGAPLSLDGVVSPDDGTVVCYLRGPDSSLEEILVDHAAVANVRGLSDSDGRVEVTLTGTTPMTVLISQGATVQDGEYTTQGARLVVHLPSDANPRQFVGAVSAEFDGVELVAKREQPRGPDVSESFEARLERALTDKQRQVLRTAYLADYFQSPRGSTSTEIAEALDITGPTVLYHLRRAQQKLLNGFFESERQSGLNTSGKNS